MSFTGINRLRSAPVVYFGPGAVGELAGALAELGAERVVLVTDPGVRGAGLVDRVVAGLAAEVTVYDAVQPEPPYHLAEECAALLGERGAQAVIGLGGGSSLDTAKMAAALARNPGSVGDYWGLDRLRQKGLPVVAIPTTAGTSSEISAAAVFVDPAAGAKRGVNSNLLLPTVAIMDPVLTLGLPPALTASTGMDALTHAIEAYASPKASPVTEGTGERAVALIAAHLPVAWARGSDLEARTGMLAGCYFAGLALAEVNVGLGHALAQALGGRYPVAHGLANAMFLPRIMRYNRIACRGRYARLAGLLGEVTEGLSEDESALLAVEAVERLTVELGIPQRLRDVGVPREGLAGVADACLETQTRQLANNPRTVTRADALRVLEEAW
jgi:alcohol dehydrogenase class IV